MEKPLVEEKAKKVFEEYEKLNLELSNPEIINDKDIYQKKIKRHSEITPIVDKYKEYIDIKKRIKEDEEILKKETDNDMKKLAEEELNELKYHLEEVKKKLKSLLLPKDPDDSKNAIIEIRAGTGGEEAALFAGELFRMYSRYAEKKGFEIEILDSHPTELGGFKEVIFMVNGKDAYSIFKYEKGIHRVQRVPVTESGGRIHTSAVSVAVLPEQEEKDVNINPDDLRIDIFRASGAGGQHVNKTESAVRIIHIPTGIEVSCQDERSQHKNKQKAMKILLARIKEKQKLEEREKLDKERKSQVGSGDRSEKIRTYNFPQNRVTDHRIGLTLYNLPEVMEGELDEIITKLKEYFEQKKFEEIEN